MTLVAPSDNAGSEIIIHQSELEFVAGLAAPWGDIETGGDKFGLQKGIAVTTERDAAFAASTEA